MLLLVCQVDSVLPVGTVVNHPAQALIAVAHIHQQDMRALLIIVAYQMVGEKGLSAARGTEDELVPVRDDSPLHGQVRNVHMYRNAVLAVRHADAEGTGRAPVIGLPRKEAYRLFQKGIERLPRREIARVAGNARPVEHRGIYGIMPWRAFHHGKLAARIVLDTAELLRVLRPGDDIAVASDGQQPLPVCLVQIHLRPFLVHGVAPAVP